MGARCSCLHGNQTRDIRPARRRKTPIAEKLRTSTTATESNQEIPPKPQQYQPLNNDISPSGNTLPKPPLETRGASSYVAGSFAMLSVPKPRSSSSKTTGSASSGKARSSEHQSPIENNEPATTEHHPIVHEIDSGEIVSIIKLPSEAVVHKQNSQTLPSIEQTIKEAPNIPAHSGTPVSPIDVTAAEYINSELASSKLDAKSAAKEKQLQLSNRDSKIFEQVNDENITPLDNTSHLEGAGTTGNTTKESLTEGATRPESSADSELDESQPENQQLGMKLKIVPSGLRGSVDGTNLASVITRIRHYESIEAGARFDPEQEVKTGTQMPI